MSIDNDKFQYVEQIRADEKDSSALFCALPTVEGGVIHIIILAVHLFLGDALAFTNLTKSKRCPKALDT